MNNQTNNERQRKERKLIKRQIDNIRFAQIFLGQRLTVSQLITIRELEAKLNQQEQLTMTLQQQAEILALIALFAPVAIGAFWFAIYSLIDKFSQQEH